jgi:hypothetical protein
MAADGPSVSAFSEPPLQVTSLLPSDAPVEILGVESSIPPSSSRPTRPVAAAGPEWSVYPLAMAPGDLAPPPLPGFPDADKGIDSQGLPLPSALEPPVAPSDFGISDGASEPGVGRDSEPAPAASVASAYAPEGLAGNGDDEALDAPNRAAGKKRNPWIFVVAAALTLGVGAAVFTSALSSSPGDKPGAASATSASAMTKSASAATAETPNSGTKAGIDPGVASGSSALAQVPGPGEPTNREAPAKTPAAPTPAEPPATEPAKGKTELAQKPLEAPPPAPEPPKPKAPEPTAATPPPTPAPGAGSGTLNINAPAAKGHRVFVDGKVVINGQGAVNVPCGVRSVKIGSAGKPQDLTVPCGGSVNLD